MCNIFRPGAHIFFKYARHTNLHFPADRRSISGNAASLNTLVHDV